MELVPALLVAVLFLVSLVGLVRVSSLRDDPADGTPRQRGRGAG